MATLTAFCKAATVTRVGSMTPISIMSPVIASLDVVTTAVRRHTIVKIYTRVYHNLIEWSLQSLTQHLSRRAAIL